jgi:hypothetical protein
MITICLLYLMTMVKPKMRDLALIPIERTWMSPRGGAVNRRFKTFTIGLTKAE